MRKRIWRAIFKMMGKGPNCFYKGHKFYQAKGVFIYKGIGFDKMGCRRHFCPFEKYIEISNYEAKNDPPPLS